jgi:hypothetical protein
MNSPFKYWALAALLLTPAGALRAQGPFDVVPRGDATYAGLAQLASAGLLPGRAASYPLTRFEVAKLLDAAEGKAIVLAQADDIPDPENMGAAEGPIAAPSSEPAASPAPSTGSGEFGDELEAPAASAGPGQAAGVLDDSPEALQKALRTLKTLKQAYAYEVGRLREGIKSLEKQITDVEIEQFELRKRLKGIEQYPTVAMHGLGRATGHFGRSSGSWPGESFFPTSHSTQAFLDMGPEGHVSKEVRWKAMFRFSSSLEPNEVPVFTVRRLEIGFHPPWFSLSVCDFEESYTPLTLWNRNSLDLRYYPESVARHDDWEKYGTFQNNEPNWSLRGARASTRFMWQDPSVIESFQVSTFAHMIRNGFDDTNGDGWYFGPLLHTDWLLGAKARLATQDLWLGSSPLKFTLDAHGLMMDQDQGSDSPLAAYDPNDPTTWARHYLVGSVRPELRLGGEAGLAICLGMEYGHTFLQDDQRDPNSTFNDFAMLGGVSLKWRDSSIALNYLNVGPYYYSPMAQLRQRSPLRTLTDGIFGETTSELPQTFFSGIPRPEYGYYDRTQDNTFPYGLATPNREGFGGELDLKFLEKDALKLLGSVYYVWEITGNLVVNGAGTGFVPVENPLGPVMNTRNFLYINLGPSLDLGHLVGLSSLFEVGVNVRYERTDSAFGALTGLWLMGGVEVEILPFWRIGGSISLRNVEGSEVGLDGTALARYPYLYDDSDRGDYLPIAVSGQEQVFEVSNAFPVNKNSTIYLDGGVGTTDFLPWGGPQGELTHEFVELHYEIKF